MATAASKSPAKKRSTTSAGRATAKKPKVASEDLDIREEDLVIDQGMMTYGEWIDLEELTGRPRSELSVKGNLTALAVTGMLFLRLRKRNPGLTFDQVKALPIDTQFRPGEVRPTKAARKTKR